jgi:hypothetical protein
MPDNLIPINGKGQIFTSNGSSRISIAAGTSGQIVTSLASSTGNIVFSSGNTKDGWFGILSGNISANVTTLTISEIPQTYQDFMLIFQSSNSNLSTQVSGDVSVRLNSDSSSLYGQTYPTTGDLTGVAWSGGGTNSHDRIDYKTLSLSTSSSYPNESAFLKLIVYRYASTSSHKPFYGTGHRYNHNTGNTAAAYCFTGGGYRSNNGITEINIFVNQSTRIFRATQTSWSLFGRGIA